VFRATKKSLQSHTENYLKELEDRGRYVNVLWPPHCELNTSGWLLEEEFAKSLTKWEVNNLRRVNYIAKGNNPMTEFFSALEAEVPQPDDHGTHLNISIIQAIEEADEIIFGGLAKSHCLKFTMKSIFDNFSNGEYLKKCVLLEDCTESVQGYEQQGDDFVKEMVGKGMKVSTSSEYLS
jgi:nicotinamidase/pyrazinamidase